jgi:hypothetical protein
MADCGGKSDVRAFAPANYRVPQGLRDALLKYKEQISKTERAGHGARFAAGQADEKQIQALTATERFTDIVAKGDNASVTEAKELRTYQFGLQQLRKETAEADISEISRDMTAGIYRTLIKPLIDGNFSMDAMRRGMRWMGGPV